MEQLRQAAQPAAEAVSAALHMPAPARDEAPRIPAPHAEHAGSGFRLTFTQGLLVGQLSIILLAVLFIKYFIFEDVGTALEKEKQSRMRRSQQARERAARRRTQKSSEQQAQAASAGARAAGSSLIASLLQCVGYDLSSHAAESSDWLNVLLAQAVAGYREDVLAGGHAALGKAREKDPAPGEAKERTAREFMQDILNRSTGTAASFLDPIRVTEVDFGDQYPLFSNARVRPADDAGRMRIEVDVDYADHITMAIDTKLVFNMPRPRFAVLPISLSLTITRFSGTLAIELFSTDPSSFVLPPEPPASVAATADLPRSRHRLHFSLHPDFALDATASSLLGSRAKLQDVPKIEQLLVGRLRAWVHERFVWPRYWSLSLPNLVPSPAAADPPLSRTESSSADSIVLNGEPQMDLVHGIDPRKADRQLDAWREPTASATTGSRTSAASADLRRRFQGSAGGWGRLNAPDDARHPPYT